MKMCIGLYVEKSYAFSNTMCPVQWLPKLGEICSLLNLMQDEFKKKKKKEKMVMAERTRFVLSHWHTRSDSRKFCSPQARTVRFNNLNAREYVKRSLYYNDYCIIRYHSMNLIWEISHICKMQRIRLSSSCFF